MIRKSLIIRFVSSILPVVLTFAVLSSCTGNHLPVDRYALVNRHNIVISEIDSLNALSVGNGGFAFTVDITGLQTFHEYHSRGIPLGTMADWGWHSEINTNGYSISQVYRTWDVHGRKVDYVHRYSDRRDTLRYMASEWLRENPHKIHLGMIGLDFPGTAKPGKGIIRNPVQKLDLWKGIIESRFGIEGRNVTVKTVCHPDLDMISSSVSSGLLADKKLRIKHDISTFKPIKYASSIDRKG